MVSIIRPNYERAIHTPLPMCFYRKAYQRLLWKLEQGHEDIKLPWWAELDKLEAIFPMPALAGVSVSGGFRNFTSNGTFNNHIGEVRVFLIGPGGNGAPGDALKAGGGGGGGGCSIKLITIGGSVSVDLDDSNHNAKFGGFLKGHGGAHTSILAHDQGGAGGGVDGDADSSKAGGDGASSSSRFSAGGGGGGAGWNEGSTTAVAGGDASGHSGGGGGGNGGNGGQGDRQQFPSNIFAQNGANYGGGGGGDSDSVSPTGLSGTNHGLGAQGCCRVEW